LYENERPNPNRGLLFLWGVGGIATLIGLAGVLVTGWNIKEDLASKSWPEITGEITASSIGSSTSRSSADGAYRTSRSDTDYSVRLSYTVRTYEVEAQTHEGSRLRFGSTSHDKRSDAQKEQRQFSKGKKVAVYYDPEKPTAQSSCPAPKGTGGNSSVSRPV